MLGKIIGEDTAGVNRATFLEYGTQNTIVIALQNYGLSRHSADYIFKKFKDCLKIEGDTLIEIHILRNSLSKEEIEYEEISSILFSHDKSHPTVVSTFIRGIIVISGAHDLQLQFAHLS